MKKLSVKEVVSTQSTDNTMKECQHLHQEQLLSASENERWVCLDCDEPIPPPNTMKECKTCHNPLITDWHDGDCIKCARDKTLSSQREEMIGILENNWRPIGRCPDCGYESSDYVKCQNPECGSGYGRRQLRPTMKEAIDDVFSILKGVK